jgi:hypothetical protein
MRASKRDVTIYAIKEALAFIKESWGNSWEGGFNDFMANVISDNRVSSYDVEAVLRSHTKDNPIKGFEGLSVIRGAPRQFQHYKIRYKPQ